MIKEDIKFQSSVVFEGMTSIRAIIKGNEAGVNNRKISKILFDKDKIKKIAKDNYKRKDSQLVVICTLFTGQSSSKEGYFYALFARIQNELYRIIPKRRMARDTRRHQRT